ncbi:MAG: urate hydroxylase PuuD [Thermoanaerobaculia bacterium]
MINWPGDFATNFQFLLRWLHFLAGITWIGMLYFFNLVNVQFQKELDAATKGKVVPILMPKALWWFRWGAVFTWFSGAIYYFLILDTEASGHMPLVYLLVGWSIAFVVLAALFRASVAGGPLKDGRVLALVIAIVVAFIAYGTALMAQSGGSSSRSISIIIGGGLGTVMFLNVWMIIWPLQKKIISAVKATAETGAPAPADQAKWARRAFLASRANAWLSIPMLFFMGAASHFPMFSTVDKVLAP